MNRHSLFLDIPTVNNPYIFSIKDVSAYEETLPVNCEQLEIIPPGFNKVMTIKVEKDFDLKLTSSPLGITSVGSENIIPDGLYQIKYSVNPNNKIFVEYYHLRLTSTLIKYYKCIGDVDLCFNELSKTEKKLISDYRDVKSFLDIAKSKIEDHHDIDQGFKYYFYALEKLNKLCNSNNCKNC